MEPQIEVLAAIEREMGARYDDVQQQLQGTGALSEHLTQLDSEVCELRREGIHTSSG